MHKIFGLLLCGLHITAGQAVGQGKAASIVAPSQAAVRFDQTTVRSVLNQKIPAEIQLPAGKLVEAKKWTDANGQNLLFVVRTPERPEPLSAEGMEAGRRAELYVRQYTSRNSRYQELWRLQDAVENCIVDITLATLPGSTTITDLDNDGHTETTILYRLACRGDVSPANLKLIMREGKAKYALRGEMIQLLNHGTKEEQKRAANKPLCCADGVKPTDDYSQLEGLYQNEKEFATAPPAFLAYARQQWRRWRASDRFE
ncbi:hypothetical protein [Hymenobacter sp. YC55]|uniref:M949_RS01915 family surface polysaccharide biosynthesis protein n=1 Tax=Hymenobacter sp. YC55 TaxID=3034019 RepID=UPI0023F6F126|nr:hypothetical protein [Hymenobacter sp. YC55]MDF7814529.1 hypothetical protein [Hymenobacter sp. YC55]